MARGFSLYAPVIGVILGSLALMIMAALMNEEVARITYLRMLRASYAYALPVQTMRYDGLLSFSVYARTWFQEHAITPDEDVPDIDNLVRTFVDAFSTAVGGDIVTSRVNWPEGSVETSVEAKDDYVVIDIVPKGVGPTYTLTLKSDKGEENLVVPIFDGETHIYIPFPYGRVRELAEELQEAIKEEWPEGIAYGYCMENIHSLWKTGWDELEEEINNWLEQKKNDYDWVEKLAVKNAQTEVNEEVVCVEGTTYRGYLVYVAKKDQILEPPCKVVIELTILGVAKVGGVESNFTVVVSPWSFTDGGGKSAREELADLAESWEEICQNHVCKNQCNNQQPGPCHCMQMCMNACTNLPGHPNVDDCKGVALDPNLKKWVWIRRNTGACERLQ